MKGRYCAAIVAFAVTAAIANRAPLLPEFLLQLRDPNLLGGAVFGAVLATFGYAVVLALCAALSGCAVLVCAWRARTRGANDWHAALAASLAALTLGARAGVSLDPIGWLCAAACCLLLERDDDGSILALTAVMTAWSLLQGGAALGSVLILCALAGAFADRGSDPALVRRALRTIPAFVIGVVQLHSAPWHAYGAHALYLDALRPGAQRDLLWNGNVSPPTLGFAAIVIVAAWYGIRRRERMGDAFTFFALLVLTLVDARMLPYFGIAAAPVAVDALASYYVVSRSAPRGSTLRYSPAGLAACAAFIAFIAVTEPKVTLWPQAYGEPGRILAFLRTHDRHARILCTRPRWCDGIPSVVPGASVVADDRSGVIPRDDLRVEAVVAAGAPQWRSSVRQSGADAVVASQDDSIAELLAQTGWHVRAADGGKVLLQP